MEALQDWKEMVKGRRSSGSSSECQESIIETGKYVVQAVEKSGVRKATAKNGGVAESETKKYV